MLTKMVQILLRSKVMIETETQLQNRTNFRICSQKMQ
jgi:hypothetical protein